MPGERGKMGNLAQQSLKTSVRFTLCAEPENVQAARELTDVTILHWGLRPLLENARLIVSELFTNAVRAARSADLYLLLTHEHTAIRLGVWDPSPDLPVMVACDPRDESGRGLHIVAALSDDHGCHRVDDPPGKVVWAALHI
jgi:anti-sigma regulatory factor (Ser/Thr protein kinase)